MNNWAGNITRNPSEIAYPTSEEAIQQLVLKAANDEKKVRAIGTGHSFTALCQTDDILLSLDKYQGIISVDKEQCQATLKAGTKLRLLGELLFNEGMAMENMGDVEKNRILVTGASSGLGKEIAYLLAVKHKAHVIVTGRRMARLQALKEAVAKEGGIIEPHSLDMTDKEQIKAFIETIALNGLNGMILNAGITVYDFFETITIEKYYQLIQTNVSANIQLIHGLIKPLEKTKGRILIVASLGGMVPVPYQSVYAGSKAFMMNFGFSLREELKHKGISVQLFAPGGFTSEMTDTENFSALGVQLASANEIAQSCIKNYIQKESLSIPGFQNKLVAFISRFVPKTFIATQAGKIYRKSLLLNDKK